MVDYDLQPGSQILIFPVPGKGSNQTASQPGPAFNAY